MRLDRTIPYEQVIGVEGVMWTQNGHYFAGSGAPVRLIERPIPAARRQKMLNEADDPSIVPETETVIEPMAMAEEPVAETGDDLDGKHWRELKALVESYGYTWVDKATALRDLRTR